MFDLNGSGAEPLEAEDPRWIGSIPVLGKLGSGGMGRVYLGVHEGRYAAVKQVLPSIVAEEFVRRFGQELDNLSRLPAEATAPLLASDRTARPPWFATAYVPGLTLREAIELHGAALPPSALWLVLREAASGLAAVHARNMVHRDVKPSNVMLTLDGLTLIDFGVARAAEQSQLTSIGIAVGTPPYMSPEQASGKARLTGAADVFALGSVVAYAASGRPPFGDDSGHAVLYRIVHEEPDLEAVREVDPGLAEVVAACLDKDPDGRPTAAEILQLASEHGPFTDPLWPDVITERLSERAAFAATVPEVDEPPAPVPTLPSAEPGPKPEARPKRRERRRTRVLLAVIPVVAVTGTTLAIRYLPYASSPGDEARATPSASVSASVVPTPSSSGGTKPGKSPSPPPAGEDKGTGGSQAEASTGTGGAQDGSGGSGSSGGSGGSGGSSSSGGSTGSSGSTSSGGKTGSSSSGGSGSGGYYQLKNNGNGECLMGADYSVTFETCSDSPATSWAYKSGSNGTYQLVNEHTGTCLTASGGGYVQMGECDGSTQRLWRTGSGDTLQSMSNSMCLDVSAGWPSAATCESGKVSQRWTRK